MKTQRLCCPRCRGIFFTTKYGKVYCSDECRKAAENARRRIRSRAAHPDR